MGRGSKGTPPSLVSNAAGNGSADAMDSVKIYIVEICK